MLLVCWTNQAQNYQLQWNTSPLSGMTSTNPTLLATDISGNTIVVGSFTSTLTIGTSTLTSAGANDIYIIKYSYNGQVLWSKKISGTGEDMAKSVTTDNYGNIYIVGTFASTQLTFATGITLSKTGTSNLFIAKYDATGTSIWARTGTSSGQESATAVKADTLGNLYVGGNYEGADLTFGNNATLTNNNSSSDIFITKMDSSGNFIWSKSNTDGSDDDYLTALSLDSANNICIAGNFTSQNLTLGSTSATNTQPNNTTSDTFFADGFIAKLNSSGDTTWLKTVKGSKSEGISSMALDQMDNVVVVGYTMSPNVTISNATSTLTPSTAKGFLAKFDSSGNGQWIKSPSQFYSQNNFNGNVNNAFIPSLVAIDKSNNIFTILNNPNPPSASVIVKVNSDGSESNNPISNNINMFNSSALSVDDFGIAIANYNNTNSVYKYNPIYCGTVADLPSGFNWYNIAANGTPLTSQTPISNTTLANNTYYGVRLVNGIENGDRLQYNFSTQSSIFFRDADGDGFGDSSNSVVSCSTIPPMGYVTNNVDCDDTNPSRTTLITLYRDADGDGYGDPATSISNCGILSGYVTNADDCDDTNSNLHGARYFLDADGDGYVNLPSVLMCTDNNTPAFAAPSGYISYSTMLTIYPNGSSHYSDCNDSLASVHPDATEIYFDGIDQDCNGYIDDAKIINSGITSNTSLVYSEYH